MATRVQIGDKWISRTDPVFVIAEAGINHQGDVKIAESLVDIAAFAGADSVKFQKRNIKSLLTKEGYDKLYENPNSFGKTYGEHREALELSLDEFRYLKKYSESKGLIFLASPWDEDSANFLDSIDIVAFKMASADLNNLPFLEHVAKKGKPMIVSTGMADMSDVEKAFDLIKNYTNDIVLLQCTSTYPSAFKDINLNVIKTFLKKFDCPIGYSGHERGIAIPIAAVALGARVIERHFTIDRTMKGGDHAASLEPGGLQKMIRDIRVTEEAFGNGVKTKQSAEAPVAEKLKKSLVSSKPIMAGTKITAEHLIAKCPGTGIPPSEMDKLIGKVAKQNIGADKILQWELFE